MLLRSCVCAIGGEVCLYNKCGLCSTTVVKVAVIAPTHQPECHFSPIFSASLPLAGGQGFS